LFLFQVLYGDIGAFNQVKRRRREVKPAQGPRIADRVADIVLRNFEKYNRTWITYIHMILGVFKGVKSLQQTKIFYSLYIRIPMPWTLNIYW